MLERLDARAVILMVVLTAIWGGSFTFVKLGLRDLPVFGSICLRFLLAAGILTVYCRWTGIPLWYTGRSARYLLASAAAFAWGQSLLYLGLNLTTAGRGSIFFNTQPFFTLLLLPLFIPEETFTARKLVGTVVAFSGVVLLFLEKLGGGSGWALLGDVLTLLATLGWSANNIITKRVAGQVHPTSLILWSSAGALPVMVALTLLLESRAPWRFTATAIASVLYLGGIAAAFSFVIFAWLIQHYSAIRVNAFVFLTPVFGVLIGWALLGETLSASQLAGALLVAAGILIVNTEPRSRSPHPTPSSQRGAGGVWGGGSR
ncbi:MAG TPA: DMT family transporter [Methylomirabilota bacterium]|nr:DMT family transporter [Methylomirabilota bacterium]